MRFMHITIKVNHALLAASRLETYSKTKSVLRPVVLNAGFIAGSREK
jgi:hypothetical protein